jgi:hypothetical protein
MVVTKLNPQVCLTWKFQNEPCLLSNWWFDILNAQPMLHMNAVFFLQMRMKGESWSDDKLRSQVFTKSWVFRICCSACLMLNC